MQVKNLTKNDIIFQYEAETSTPAWPIFETINIVAGWTVEIPERSWKMIAEQNSSIQKWKYEEVPFSKMTAKDADGNTYVPTKLVAFEDGEPEVVNMIKNMVKTRQIELVSEASQDELRAKFENAAKLMGIKVTEKMSLEEIKVSMRAVKEAMDLV